MRPCVDPATGTWVYVSLFSLPDFALPREMVLAGEEVRSFPVHSGLTGRLPPVHLLVLIRGHCSGGWLVFVVGWKTEMKEQEPPVARDNGQPEGEGRRPQPLFPLGQVLSTPGALEALAEVEQEPLQLLARHVTGDWGQVPDEDKAENDFSVERQLRILSAYVLPTGVKVWVITEADRSATTFLLPSEY